MSIRYVGLAKLEAMARAAMVAAVTESAEHLVGESQGAAPVDTGTLKASIHTDGASIGAGGITARVSTGGEADDYAVYVHEGHYARHGAPAGGGQGPRNATWVPPQKFLEEPLLENRPTYVEAMARAARGAF